MRYLLGFLCVCGLGVMPVVGCSETAGDGGSGGTAGDGGSSGTGDSGGSAGAGGMGGAGGGMGNVFPCTEQGIRDAIARGGGPHYFECDGTAPVLSGQTIIIDKSVVLDGEGKLTVDGGDTHRVFEVTGRTGYHAVELRGITVTGGRGPACRSCQAAGAILNEGGNLTLIDCTVTDNKNLGFNPYGVGLPGNILNSWGDITIINSTVSNNIGGGIGNRGGLLTVTNSTVSNNTGLGPETDVWPYGVFNLGHGFLTNSTISGSVAIYMGSAGRMDIAASLIDGDCSQGGDQVTWASNGYNIESPGDTCGFDHGTDLVNITEGQLDQESLADNGGPTMTHALGGDSVAIDHIPAIDCEVTEDQRGLPRPETRGDACDVGSFERQPEDP